jgi:lycopene beta-cyclase
VGTGEFELVLVGGGLQNGLVALAVLDGNPRRRVALVEAGAGIGGNHTWCMHPHDVPERARAWVEPLFAYRWPRYEVRFPGGARTLEAPYAAITSARFAERVHAAIARSARSAVYLGRRATHVAAHDVELDDGTTLSAELVVDSRGPERGTSLPSCGFQKFLGIELALDRPHGLAHPVLMDATVEQRDGFRFVYALPFGADRLLVEDTSFAGSPELDPAASRVALLDYAARFAPVSGIVREEGGVLPMPWASAPVPPRRSPLVAGYRGGWFHPATGYSLPPAIRLACHLGERKAEDVFDERLARMYRRHRAQVRFAQRLNRLLFHCFAPEDAWNVFARFYKLPDDVIHRFYALSLTAMDRARLLVGRPPPGFSFARALTLARLS